MVKLKFWKGFWTGIATILAIIGTVIGIIVGCLTIFGGHAKPQLLPPVNCAIRPEGNVQGVNFDLLVNNVGSKDCSVISIGLVWPDGREADLRRYEPSLPKKVSPGQTERIAVKGYCHKFDANDGVWGKLKLQPNQLTTKGTAIVRFNTNKVIEQEITFSIERLY